jgi:16S rRNA (uracil1498-N3)-methyltransferase
MDFIIEKCAELGVWSIIPMVTERTIAASMKLDRWKKLAKEAAEQCTRATIPEITNLQTFEEILKSAKQYHLALIPWELEKKKTLKQALKSLHLPHILVVIGPEGGFSQKEIESAKRAGFTSVSLGPRILRTETAGLAILSMINYEYEQ